MVDDIINVKNIIIIYFFNNNIKNSCLAQSFIFYKYLKKIGMNPQLIKGYIYNNDDKIYYGHFWIECDNVIYDIATETYVLFFNEKLRNNIKEKRCLTKKIPNDYKCLDNDSFEEIRNNSYVNCLNDQFLYDVQKNAHNTIYNKIKCIYDLIINS